MEMKSLRFHPWNRELGDNSEPITDWLICDTEYEMYKAETHMSLFLFFSFLPITYLIAYHF